MIEKIPRHQAQVKMLDGVNQQSAVSGNGGQPFYNFCLILLGTSSVIWSGFFTF